MPSGAVLLKKINKKIAPSCSTRVYSKHVILKTTTGAPASANKVGALCWNSFDGDAYICTVVTGTWVKINA